MHSVSNMERAPRSGRRGVPLCRGRDRQESRKVQASLRQPRPYAQDNARKRRRPVPNRLKPRRKSGLTYVSHTSPGIALRRSQEKSFTYVDAQGKKVRDGEDAWPHSVPGDSASAVEGCMDLPAHPSAATFKPSASMHAAGGNAATTPASAKSRDSGQVRAHAQVRQSASGIATAPAATWLI